MVLRRGQCGGSPSVRSPMFLSSFDPLPASAECACGIGGARFFSAFLPMDQARGGKRVRQDP